MIPTAEIKKKMSCVAFSFIFFILVPCSLPPGSCDDFSFSICWMTKGDTFERSDGNIWLNDIALKAVRSLGKFTSLTVSPTVENKLSLQYGGTVHKWAFSITPSASSIEIRGLRKPQEHPSSATQETLQQLSPTEVFACENGTLFFHQDENFILAIGHTLRLPIGLESRGPSMLLVTWMESRPAAADAGDTRSLSLYLTELGAYTAVSRNATTHNHYLFSGLESCSPYLACVELTGTQSLTCLSTVTDPDEPGLFQVTSWNSSSITVAWDSPNSCEFSAFLLTAFYLNGTDHITQELSFWQRGNRSAFTLSDLAPCSRVKLGLQTGCQAGPETRYSKMVLIDGNSGPRGVSDLSYRPNNSTAMWTPGTPLRAAVTFLYDLSLENGTAVQSSRVSEPELHLPGLADGETYFLNVWEECDGQWKSGPSLLSFDAVNVTLERLMLPVGPDSDLELQSDFSPDLVIVVPWLFTGELQDATSEPRVQMEKVIKNKVQQMLGGFHRPARVQLSTVQPLDRDGKTQIVLKSFDTSVTDADVPLPVADQLDHIQSLQLPNITVSHGVVSWDGPDECASSKQSVCPSDSLCINTLGSYMCVCRHGYYDVASVIMPSVASPPFCSEKGLFSRCQDKMIAGGVAKAYLVSLLGGKVDVELNDGRCVVNESETSYYFNTSRKTSECGTRRLVNKTHIEYQNTLSVTLSKEHIISRRDLQVVWRCVYPRNYVRNAQVSVDLEWISSLSLVEFNSSLELGPALALYSDESYTYSYRGAVALALEDTLFFQVALRANSSFVADVVLQVVSCWATESPDPQDQVQGLFLQDGCPLDDTFQWRSVNGAGQESRFSIQMFTMPKGLPLYFHCLAQICGHAEDCTTNCSSRQLSRRSLSKRDVHGKRAVVVSAGPLLVAGEAESGVWPSDWTDHMTMISVVAGSIGVLAITLLGVSATKAIMSYYEQLRLQ